MGLGEVDVEGKSVPQEKQHQSPSRREGNRQKSGQTVVCAPERTDGCTGTAPMCLAANCPTFALLGPSWSLQPRCVFGTVTHRHLAPGPSSLGS